MKLHICSLTARVALAVVVAGTLLPTTSAIAQEQAPDTTFLNRNIRQQKFLFSYIEEHRADGPPATEADVSTYFSGAAEAWANYAKEEDSLARRLNPYVAVWLLHSAFSPREVSGNLQCYNYTKYVVPAFLADFERYLEVDAAHASLIFWGHDWVGSSLSFSCDMEADQSRALQAAFERAPSLYQEYLDAGAFPNENVENKVQRVQKYFDERTPLYAVRGDLYRGDLNAAFAGLAAATTRGFEGNDLQPLGKILWRAYANTGQTDHALATLDLLARTLTAADLSRDTLRAWYAEVEPERGAERFGLMTSLAPSALVPSEKHANLSGTYTDLLTGEPVDLASLTGRLVLLDFWATWCRPCIAEIPELQALVAEHGDRVAFVSINADAITGAEGPDGVRAFMDEHRIDYPVLYDDPERSLVTRFRVRGYPAKFLVNSEGNLLVHPMGGQQVVSLNDVETYLEGLQ